MRERYIHYKNKKEYEIVNKCKIQENEKWIEAVIYKEKDKEGMKKEENKTKEVKKEKKNKNF